MTNPTLERAARAVQDEIERQVAEPGYLGWGVGQEDHRPPITKTYVDGDLDVSALARAVLMAVLPTLERYDYSAAGYEWPVLDSDPTGQFVYYDDLQAILNDGEGE